MWFSSPRVYQIQGTRARKNQSRCGMTRKVAVLVNQRLLLSASLSLFTEFTAG